LSSARTLTQAVLLLASCRSLKSVEIETLAAPWATEVAVGLTVMGVVVPQHEPAAVMEVATKAAAEAGLKSFEEKIGGRIMRIEEGPEPNVALPVSEGVVPVVDALKAAVVVVDTRMDLTVKTVEAIRGKLVAMMDGSQAGLLFLVWLIRRSVFKSDRTESGDSQWVSVFT
jgi:hypothetical protein